MPPRAPRSVSGIGRRLELVTEIIEAMVYAVLATAIVVGVVWVLAQIAVMAGSIVSGHPSGLSETLAVVRDEMLAVLDSVLLLIIGLDVLRTIVVSIAYRELYLVAAVEAAILAVVREIISSEIRHRSVTALMGYAVVIVLLGALWLIAQREFRRARRLEAGGEERGG